MILIFLVINSSYFKVDIKLAVILKKTFRSNRLEKYLYYTYSISILKRSSSYFVYYTYSIFILENKCNDLYRWFTK